ncbi:MAG TPA: carbohydrate ABC transporter permease [Chloroflexota bacterium]|nr:carbohydrate ABC transporter permease [Chloroflexota bacterium]
MQAIQTKPRMHGAQYRRRRLAANIVVTAILVVLCYYFIAPVVWLFLSSTKTQEDLFVTPALWFGSSFQFWNNLVHVMGYNDGIFWVWTRNSLIYTVPSVILTVLTSAGAGYGLAKYHFPGRTVLLLLVVFSLLIPTTALAVPIYLEGAKLGLVNTPLGVILPSSASAFGVWICYNFFNHQFNTEIIQAARIDGANEYQIFGRIAIPSAVGVLATVTILTFVGNWNNFFLPFLMESRDDLMPLPVGLGNMAAQTTLGSQASSAAGSAISIMDVLTGAFLVTIPVIVVFVLVRRYWAAGLLSGSLQGQ